jgi:hypothetical protein
MCKSGISISPLEGVNEAGMGINQSIRGDERGGYESGSFEKPVGATAPETASPAGKPAPADKSDARQ